MTPVAHSLPMAARTSACATLLLLVASALLHAQPETPLFRAGPLQGGGTLLPTGWIVKPAGRQVPLDTLPMNSVLTPDGKFLVVLHAGFNQPSLHSIATDSWKTVHTLDLPDAWLGMAMTINGRLLYVSGGSTASIFEVALSPEGRFTRARTFELVASQDRTAKDFLGDVVFTPDNRLLFVADLFHDRVLVVNPQSGRVIDRFRCRRRPYRILFHPDGKSYFVTSWADGTLQQFQTDDGFNTGTLRLGAQTTDMVWREKRTSVEEGEEFPFKARLFVSASNTNRVYSVGITESKEMRLIEPINAAITARTPLGMTPSALALNADESRLFIVCSDLNAVAVADVAGPRAVPLGFIPTGWYPSMARSLPDGRLVVLNALGSSSRPSRPQDRDADYDPPVPGSASIVAPFDELELHGYTRAVFDNTPYGDQMLDALDIAPGHPVQPAPGAPSPIQHVVYIVKSGLSYDRVFGRFGKGAGRATPDGLGETIVPNHHQLAKDFVLLDNFYANGSSPHDGLSWSIAASAPSFLQRLAPAALAGRLKFGAFDGEEPASFPPAGYIWTQALSAGLSVRNYGMFAENAPLKQVQPGSNHVTALRDSPLAAVTEMRFRGFDPEYPDHERARIFLADLARFEANSTMPRFLILRLANDRTAGRARGAPTPAASIADNDYALGMIVEALTRSKFWPKMAVFVAEDSASGFDHVDGHRAPAFVLSPYTRRGGAIDSNFYNTTSMLRTIEILLGLRPMTLFDAASPPMLDAFAFNPDTTPFRAVKPRVSLDERNPAP